jgi:hypothetical protein
LAIGKGDLLIDFHHNYFDIAQRKPTKSFAPSGGCESWYVTLFLLKEQTGISFTARAITIDGDITDLDFAAQRRLPLLRQ